MRKITFILALLASSQLTGCVAHRYYNDTPNRDYRGYNNQYPAQYPEQTPYQNSYQNQYQNQSEVAQIVGIRTIGEVSRSNGGGAVIGALIGGIIGNQLGRGDEHSSRHHYRHGNGYGYGHHYERSHSDDGAGRAVATIGGAIIGGAIGNEVDRNSTEQRVRTEITLRFANGQAQAILLDNPGQFRVGDRVRVSFQGGRWVIL